MFFSFSASSLVPAGQANCCEWHPCPGWQTVWHSLAQSPKHSLPLTDTLFCVSVGVCKLDLCTRFFDLKNKDFLNHMSNTI